MIGENGDYLKFVCVSSTTRLCLLDYIAFLLCLVYIYIYI